MTWLFTLLAMAVIAAVAALVTGRISGGMDAPESSLPFRGLPPEQVTAADLEALRFTPALRGYRMDQVDEVLDRLEHELAARDDEITRLRAALDPGNGPEPDEHATPGDQGPDRPQGENGTGHAFRAPTEGDLGQDAEPRTEAAAWQLPGQG